jgi:hypothetical protein
MEERKKWLEAIDVFRNDIDAKVLCPHCAIGSLIVTDIAFDNDNIDKGGERIIKCSCCGEYTTVLYRVTPENWFGARRSNE